MPVPMELRNQDYPNYDLRAIRIADLSVNRKEAFHPTLLSKLYYGMGKTEFTSMEDLGIVWSGNKIDRLDVNII